MDKKILEEILGLNDPLKMFDLVVAASYFAAQLGNPVPVDESRIVFKAIKDQQQADLLEQLEGKKKDVFDRGQLDSPIDSGCDEGDPKVVGYNAGIQAAIDNLKEL